MRARSGRRWAAWLVLPLLALGLSLAGCGSPPQILEITPAKGAQEVPTNQPIKIRFDRALDRQSVEKRFSLRPGVSGSFGWEAHDTLVFTHDALQPSTQYTVTLVAGYRDSAGNVNGFNHSWVFVTEAPPALRASSPGQGESGVDPATYVALTFSREMNAESFRGSISFSPSVTFSVEADSQDPRRILVAPKSLLLAGTSYDVTVTDEATDADGNHLASLKLHFVTGPVRSLSRWITFLATPSGSASGSGVWMVDDAGFPRILEDTTVDDFNWSPDGTNLLVRHPDQTWADFSFGGPPVELPFTAGWAAYLGHDAGYLYISGGDLRRSLPNGDQLLIASDVTVAAVSRDLGRVAFVRNTPAGRDIRAYDVSLRAQYRLQQEVGEVSVLRWSPDGARLAYLVAEPNATLALKVKSLSGSGGLKNVATGYISEVSWLADSSEVTFAARPAIGLGSGPSRIYRVNTALPPAQLSAAAAIGPATEADAFLPQPSPDGHQIAFLVGTPDSAQIWLMNADGTGATRLTGFDPDSFPYGCRDLHWASA